MSTAAVDPAPAPARALALPALGLLLVAAVLVAAASGQLHIPVGEVVGSLLVAAGAVRARGTSKIQRTMQGGGGAA